MVLVLGNEADLYTPDFRDLLMAICNQAVLALQNARLYQNLMEEKDRLVTVEEDARRSSPATCTTALRRQLPRSPCGSTTSVCLSIATRSVPSRSFTNWRILPA